MHTMTRMLSRTLALALLTVPPALVASPGNGSDSEPVLRDILVTARKRTEPVQVVPGAVTVRTDPSGTASGVTDLRTAVRGVPNLTLAEFTARRLAFPYVRGIGSGQQAPGVVTYIDGVPQLTSLTANQELLGVERVEILRGPQGALYGRDSLGGVVAFVPRLPPRERAGAVTLSAGSHDARGGQFTLEGPVGDSGWLGSLGGGYARRDGFTKNTLTGQDVDHREAWFGRMQLLLPDRGDWDVRLSLTTQRDRDGGYALYDLERLRATPHRVAHDWEGYNHRDLAQPVITLQRHGRHADFISITAWQWWQTRDRTDLDYTPADLARKDAAQDGRAWIQEWRLMSPADDPVILGDRIALAWLASAFAFHERYTRRDVTDYRPGGVAFGLWPAPFRMQDDARQENVGASLFGHTTVTLDARWELGLGLRHDYQHRTAESASRIPSGPSMAASDQARTFNQVSPRASLGYRLTPHILAYADIAQGYRAGGFNAIAPPDRSTFDAETSLNYETGFKTLWLDDRLMANAALFYTDWDAIQVNSPVPGGSPADYYIENGGAACSRGAELELRANPLRGLTLFSGIGLLDTRYRSDSTSAGRPVGGHRLPFAPRLTWQAGLAGEAPLGAARQGYMRAEITGASRSYYDAWNAESQSGHALVNLRLGVASARWRAEGWVQNLFDRETVPLAIPYGQDAAGQPTYIGESGAPRTAGVSLARAF